MWKEGDKERKWMRARAGERAMIKGIIPFYYTMVLQPSMPTGQERCWIHGQLTFTKNKTKYKLWFFSRSTNVKWKKAHINIPMVATTSLFGTFLSRRKRGVEVGGYELNWPSKLRMDCQLAQEGNCRGAPDSKGPWRLWGVCAAITLC